MSNLKNRDGYDVEVSPIEKVEFYEGGGCAITRGEPGWGTFGISADELNGFVPQVGDIVVVYTQGFSSIRGIMIDGHVFKYTTPAQAETEHEQWRKNRRLEQLERYVEHGDALRARVEKLPTPLKARMYRFAAEGGTEFWIDSAGYEMSGLEGAAALLRKVRDLGFIDSENSISDSDDSEGGIQWIEDWWALNTEAHGYNYKKQKEIVPDFGEGHSGNTAAAAKTLAVLILEGRDV